MSTKRYKPEQIVTLLRQIEVEIANGKTTPLRPALPRPPAADEVPALVPRAKVPRQSARVRRDTTGIIETGDAAGMPFET